MKSMGMAVLMVVGLSVFAETNQMTQITRGVTNVPIVTIAGELVFKITGGTNTVTVLWRESVTLEQLISYCGGFTEFSTKIRVIEHNGAGPEKMYHVTDYQTNEIIRTMKIKPDTRIYVAPTY